MKSKILALIILVFLTVSMLASCSLFGQGKEPGEDSGGTQGGEGDTNGDDEPVVLPEGTIYDVGSVLKILSADTSVSSDYLNEIYNVLYSNGVEVGFANFAMAAADHEIIIGESEREISKKAYAQLAKLDIIDDYAGYVIYSDGKSIAIAYSHVSACYYAINKLIDTYFVYTPLALDSGTGESGAVSIIEYLNELDDEKQEKEWSILENAIGTDNAGEIVAAIKELYGIHNPAVVEWFANLYDPDTGGYYFSESGRDTPGYLPDLESTSQALGFFDSTKMASHWTKVLPQEMIQKIGEFAYGLQDPNGFFYHPQWTKALVDSKLSRRARDLNHGLSLIAAAGMTPKYSSAIDQIEPVEPMSALTGRIGESTVAAVSKVIAVAEIDHLASEEAFMSYLRNLSIYNKSYAPGNQLSSQTKQIQKAGLLDMCLDYLESIQNPKNGLWEDKVSYASVNGLLKLSGIWGVGERPFPYAEEAIESVIEVIMSEEEPDSVVVMYNCWYSIRNILDSMKYGDASDAALVERARAKLFELAPGAIRSTKDKVMLCQKPDGSFSWGLKYSSSTSQGCPVGVPNTYEGDVNATVIGIGGTINNMYHALGLYSQRVSIFGQAELYTYLKALEGLGSIVKDSEIYIGEPFDFENADIDSTPTDVTVKFKEGSSAVVVQDPEDENNRVLHLTSLAANNPYNKDGNGDTIVVPNTVGITANCSVFEGDFYVSSNTDEEYFMQITMDKCYMFTFIRSGEKLKIVDASSGNSTTTINTTYDCLIDLDSWFHVKIEYYTGDNDTVRIKAYVNDILVAVSDNYYDATGEKFFGLVSPGEQATETRIYCMMPHYVDMYVDNLHTYKLSQPYTIEATPESTPNVDTPDKPELVYDFSEGLHSDLEFLTDSFTIDKKTYSYVKDGVSETEFNDSKGINILSDGYAAKLQVPTTVRQSIGKCGTFGFDLQVVSAGLGDFATVKLYDKNGSASSNAVLMGITFTCIEENGERYVMLREMPGGKTGAVLEGVKIKLGDIVNIRFEFFHEEDATLIFINGLSSSASYALFSGGHKYTLGYASLETTPLVASSINVDNVKCERLDRSYATATAPSVDREIHGFNSDADIPAGKNTSIATENGNKVLLFGNGGTAAIDINRRSPVVSVTTVETLIAFKSIANGTTFTLKINSEEGETVFAIRFVGVGDKIIAYELTENGVTANALFSIDPGVEYTLKLQICPSKETANVYLNDTPVYVTNVFYSDMNLAKKVDTLLFESVGISAYIDNLYAEAINAAFTAESPEHEKNKEDTAEMLTFESSQMYNLPKHVTHSLASSGAAVRVKSMMRSGKLGNVVAFTTTAGNCDSLKFGIMNTVANSNCIAFETDVMLVGFAGDATAFQVRLGSAYMLNLGVSASGNVSLGDCSHSSAKGRTWGSFPATDVRADDWFKLRIEYYPGDKNDVRIKVYINGELIGVSNNYFGYLDVDENPASPAESVSQAYFYSISAASGTLYVDNVVTERIVKSVGDDPLTINIEHK